MTIRMVLMLAALSLAPAHGAARADPSLKDDLHGTWLAVSNVTIRPDGTRFSTFGGPVKGILIFDSDSGYTSFVSVQANLPKFSSSSRLMGSVDENKAVVSGSIAYFGRYAVDENTRSYSVNIEGSTYPNWMGLTTTRKVEISGDELTLTNPAASAGGIAVSTWKRVTDREPEVRGGVGLK
jgi:hypothetical protein